MCERLCPLLAPIEPLNYEERPEGLEFWSALVLNVAMLAACILPKLPKLLLFLLATPVRRDYYIRVVIIKNDERLNI